MLFERQVPKGGVYRGRVVAVDDAGHASHPSSPVWLPVHRRFPGGSVGQSYSHTFTDEAGPPSTVWALIEGRLPPGLALQTLPSSPDFPGHIVGRPTEAGEYSFVMRGPSGYYWAATVSIRVRLSASLLRWVERTGLLHTPRNPRQTILATPRRGGCRSGGLLL